MKKYVLMGIGNVLRGDDAIGPYIANNLNDDWHTIDCSTSPENFTGLIRRLKPQNLMIVDATHMNQEPGTIRIIPKDKIIGVVTTHNTPLSYLIEYLEPYTEKIIFIGIQPEILYGKEMSEKIKDSTEKLINILKEKNFDEIPVL